LKCRSYGGEKAQKHWLHCWVMGSDIGIKQYGDFSRVYVVWIVAMLPLGVKRIWRFYPDSSPKSTMAQSQGSFLCSLLVIIALKTSHCLLPADLTFSRTSPSEKALPNLNQLTRSGAAGSFHH